MIGLSIIIPSFKRLAQTETTITKLQKSDGVGQEIDIEIIVADNTPDDSLKNHLKSVFKDSIRIVTPDKNSIAGAKNFGAKHALHPIIIFCDTDIEVEANTLLTTAVSLRNYASAAMVGGKVIWRGGEKNEQIDRPRKEDRMYTNEKTTYIESLYSRYVATYKTVFEQVGGYDEEVFGMRGEGSDLSIRYWRQGFPLVYDEKILVHHIFDAPDSAALRVEHPSWGVAKDLLLLGLRYECFDGTAKNFDKTIVTNFSTEKDPAATVLEGIAHYNILINRVLPYIKNYTKQAAYPFRFLEVFSDENMLNDCLNNAVEKLASVRKDAFGI